MGRGMPIKKRLSHLTIVVTDAGVVPEKRKKKAKTVQPASTMTIPVEAKASQNILGAKKDK